MSPAASRTASFSLRQMGVAEGAAPPAGRGASPTCALQPLLPPAPPGALGRVPKSAGRKDQTPALLRRGEAPPFNSGAPWRPLVSGRPSLPATHLPHCDQAPVSSEEDDGKAWRETPELHVPFSAADGDWLCLGFSRSLPHVLAPGRLYTRTSSSSPAARSRGQEPKARCGAGSLQGRRERDFEGTQRAHRGGKAPPAGRVSSLTVRRGGGSARACGRRGHAPPSQPLTGCRGPREPALSWVPTQSQQEPPVLGPVKKKPC